jgi:hypothetical protein
MATKRSGKAANRRSRQRPPRRPVIPPPLRAPADDADMTDAVAAPSTPEPARAAPRSMPAIYAGASRLSERAAAEYHYVGRDLRNIAILTAIIAVILLAAWLVLPATGLIHR